jgi:hypothetical protein
VGSLGGSENAIRRAFSSQVGSLGGSENAIKRAFSSQVVSLGGSENAIKRAFSSQVASLGGSENAIKRASHTRRAWQCDLSLANRVQRGAAGSDMCMAQHRPVLSEEIV